MLRARLLGVLEVELDGTVISSSPSQRPWALFAYVALAGRPVARAELAARFWPDVLDQSARASLRSALWALRRALGEAILVEGDRVALNAEAGLWVDLAEFERLATSDPEAALELCAGELLEGIEDDWALRARESHRERVIALLEQLAQHADSHGDPLEALALTRRQVKCDAFDEDAHRRLIERLVGTGDRSGAIRAYRSFGERLRRELGVAPSSRTRALIESLRAEPGPIEATRRTAAPTGMLPLVGREHELRELELVWQAAAGGAGAAAVIRGEAGIGKTRLVSELGSRAARAGALTATSAALDLGGAAPLSLWAELTRELLSSLPAPGPEAAWPDDLAVLVSELPAHFGRSRPAIAAIAPDLLRTRLFEAVVTMLAWAARCAPLLLVLEDSHGADRPSLELAGYAARRLGGQRVMMVITRRERPRSPAADQLEHALRARGVLACELELGPLPAGAGATLARSVARLDERNVDFVVERAEGNPLLVVETARAVAGGRQEVAPGLRGLVRGTFGTLAGEARELVELAAVAGRPMQSGETAELAIAEPAAAAAEALESGLLQAAGGAIGFRHSLLRDAVYAEIAEPRRGGLHRAWAQALLARRRSGAVAGAAEIARHLRLAGDDLEAVPELARAAADARDVAALEQAAGYLREALATAPGEADLWLELGEIEAWRSDREQAEAAFARANALLSDADALRRARACLRRARAYHGPICVPRAVLESARTALELLTGSAERTDQERGEALAAWAWAEAVAGSVDEAERLLAELAEVPPANAELRTYDAGHARALALMRRGRFTDSYAPSIAAGEAIGRAGRPDLTYGCWANAAGAATAAGEFERALEFIDRGESAVAGNGLQGIEIHLLAARSFVLRRLCRLEEARAVAESERMLADRLGQPGLSAMASHDLGLVALAAGDYAQAVAHLTESLAQPAPISRPLARLALAEALARSGAPDEAAEQVRETVLEPVGPSDFPDALVPRLARAQGLIALARNDRDSAARRLEESLAAWERLVQRSVRAESITRVLADLGRPVVGLVEPEYELVQARADLNLATEQGLDAVLP